MTAKVDTSSRQALIGDLIEAFIKFGLIAILLTLCMKYFAPFAEIMAWGLILSIAISPLHQALTKKISPAISAIFVTLLLLVIIALPTALFGTAVINHIQELKPLLTSGQFSIKAPPASVADWPVIGDKVYTLWQHAATDLHQLLQDNMETIKQLIRKAAHIASGIVGSLFSMMGATIIAGIMLAYTNSASSAFDKIFNRLISPSKGSEIKHLSIGTVRSVAAGVIGVAVAQALIVCLIMYLANLPVLITAIATILAFLFTLIQLPTIIVTIPVIIYMFSGSYDGNATLWGIILFLGGTADHVLKPLLLGRGVEAPMIVILIGALGGMIQGGLLGLFVGAVILAVSYQLFMLWINQKDSAVNHNQSE